MTVIIVFKTLNLKLDNYLLFVKTINFNCFSKEQCIRPEFFLDVSNALWMLEVKFVQFIYVIAFYWCNWTAF